MKIEVVTKLEVGDAVQLRSGGPEMTIAKIDDAICVCCWFPHVHGALVDHQLLRDAFPLAGLRPVTKASA